MKLVALLSWFDEPEAFLHRTITTLPKIGVTDLITLDGRYALYPCAYDQSPPAQHQAIADAAHTAGIRLHAYQHGSWDRGEIQKRTILFDHAEYLTTPRDWYYVVDGDEEITAAEPDIPATLATTIFDVASVRLEQTHPVPDFPKFFRACRGLHCHGNHYTYRTGSGRYLWGNAKTTRLEARHPLDVTVLHHEHARSPARRSASVGYYNVRDEQGAESHNPMVIR